MPSFFEKPILNSPYESPTQHWELDGAGQPTEVINSSRRPSSFITPVPAPRKGSRRGKGGSDDQLSMVLDTGDDLSDEKQQYNDSRYINDIREFVEQWRQLPKERDWKVTPETARLLRHWRSSDFETIRPFFCQVEAVETAIWLTEVAPKMGKRTKDIFDRLKIVNEEANPEIFRIAFKLATGAGKTTVMAMLMAWQTINAVRYPRAKSFSRAFLIVTPGITIKDRLRVLQPNDPESYYKDRELIPDDMKRDMEKARIVITNYHAFKLREIVDVSKTGRALLKGRGKDIQTQETESQMIKRVMGELMSMKNIVVINDEAHHCYREKQLSSDEEDFKGDDKKEAEKNKEAARVWISGIEAINRNKPKVRVVYDLSATPFFLRGSGYAEGTLFPWVVSDFSLMDAIECGIVKLPRIPVFDNMAHDDEMPIYRNLWEHIGNKMPKKGRGSGVADPSHLPPKLQTALEALYGHYAKVFESWKKANISVPPVFIVVCNNTATSKLLYDYISGFDRENEKGESMHHSGHFELFRNYDDNGKRLSKPRTLLIDSIQLESGDALDKEFREAAAPEIEKFRQQILTRTGNQKEAENIDDATLLREVMNTVGKAGTLGEQIRCVVSVSMLTEGWDANTVTHILGVRAFGTQLLCEQVVGRALRRHSYELNEENLFDAEYANIFGIPFNFAAKPVESPPNTPRETIRVCAVRERDDLEIRFPRVDGYRTEFPTAKLTAKFNRNHKLPLTLNMTGPTRTRVRGIVGESEEFTLEHLENMRNNTLAYHLAKHLVERKYRDSDEKPRWRLFGQLKSICRQWLDEGYLVCTAGTLPGQLLLNTEKLSEAANIITGAISRSSEGEKLVKAILDPYNTEGSSIHVNFTTSNPRRYETSENKCHINYVIGDSDWELHMAEALENSPRVLAYVKNHRLGFEVPYLIGSSPHRYRPDFIVKVDDGVEGDPLNLVLEVKGRRDLDVGLSAKINTMVDFWVPGVNNLKKFGRWEFREFEENETFENKARLQEAVDELMENYVKKGK